MLLLYLFFEKKKRKGRKERKKERKKGRKELNFLFSIGTGFPFNLCPEPENAKLLSSTSSIGSGSSISLDF